MDRVSQMQTVQKEGLELFKRKNKDYGDAFAGKNYFLIVIISVPLVLLLEWVIKLIV